jgi:hypothetical protein
MYVFGVQQKKIHRATYEGKRVLALESQGSLQYQTLHDSKAQKA